MKRTLIIALFWASVLSPLCAQKNLSPSLRAHANTWSDNIVKGMRRLGFQMPAKYDPVNPPAGAANRSGDPILDSTKTFYAYGVPFPSDSTPLVRSIYRYEPLNVKIEENDQFENGNWVKLNRNTFISDDLGRDIEIEAEVFDPAEGNYIPDSRLVVFPRGNSQTLYDSVFTWRWEPLSQEWVPIFTILNSFDANDRLLESLSLLDLFGQPLWFKDKYFYDAGGDNIRIESWALIDGFEIQTSKIEMSYENRQPVETITFIVDENGQFLQQSRVTRTFVLTDKEKQVNGYEWNMESQDWQQIEAVVNDYDAEKRIVQKETSLYAEGILQERVRLTYVYKEDEHLALESSFIWDGNQFILTDRKYYYYRSTTPTRAHAVNLPLVFTPNPAIGQTQLLLDEPATINLFNAKGELVSSGVYQPNTTLLLFDLPQGLYFITARTEKEVFSGRLIKM